jgi:perosamine synthetase
VSEAIKNIGMLAGRKRPLLARMRRYVSGWKAYRYRVPYCVPYWSRKTYFTITRSLATGRIVQGPDIDKLERALSGYLSIEWVRGYRQGRVALEAALVGVGVVNGDEVILPTFCCSSVVPPVLAAGATPVLADVGPDLNITAESVEAVLTPRTKAIIVPHLFGNPADIEAIEKIAAEREIKVIDDAAQALGATLNGRPLGSFGDAGILSFGSGKVCFGTGGGILATRFVAVSERSQSIEFQMPNGQTELQEMLSILLWRRWRRNLLPVSVILHRLKFAKPADPTSVPERSAREYLSNLDAAVIMTLLETLAENIAARRQRAQLYRELLLNRPGITLIRHREGSACLNQPVKIEPTRHDAEPADAILEVLREHGYEIQGSYIPLHCLPAYRDCAPRLPVFADQVWPHVIELPCEPDVPLAEVERISNLIRSALAN